MISATGKRQAGFTLAELCVVGAILGLICLLSWPSLRAHSVSVSSRVRADALADRLRTARERSLISGSSQRVDPPGGEAAAAEFYPDGTAVPFTADIGDRAHAMRVSVDATGRVSVNAL
jgi:Tfp pilus assembly protein FimT